jgi:PKHD-type hydroxylase
VQHLLTPYAVPMEPFAWEEHVFSPAELGWLQNKALQAQCAATVGTGHGAGEDLEIRRSKLSWLYKDTECAWVFDKLGEAASRLNAQYFGFDLTGFGEAFQLTHYDGTDNGMYGWHYDYGGDKISPSRKLSLVVQLSDPSEYEGGELQIMYSSTPASVKKQRGLVAIFPAYMLHQVTPVTSGTRQTLVAWVSGPPFR